MALVMEGDYGGSIYLTCPVRLIGCDEPALEHLLHELDGHCWNDAEGARLFFECAPVGTGIAGGTGGGIVTSGVWLHPDLEALRLRQRVESLLLRADPMR